MSATEISWLGVTGVPFKVKIPPVGADEITTAMKSSGGTSFGSVKPKSAIFTMYAVSSFVVALRLVPAGCWLTSETLI